MYIYLIKGSLNYNQSNDTEDGNMTLEIEEYIETEKFDAEAALRKFFDENE